jgi:D-lactate dehydrogenase
VTLAYFDAEPQDQERLRTAFPKLSLTVLPDPLNEETASAAHDADVISVFVTSKVTRKTLAELPRVKLIVARSTGVDHVDLHACRERGIVVANVPVYGENTVAEHTFALILALSRKIFQSYERTERMKFDRKGLQGFDLFGRTLGVIGTGNIGKHVIRIGRGFSMSIIAHDVRPDAQLAGELGFSYVETLDDLLLKSDVITLHVPYLPATHHLINKENLARAKRGALLVNTARGALVDTEALLWALEEGILSGAGLDVLEEENETFEEIEFLSYQFPKDKDLATILRNHVLVARDDVIITPHNAFNSSEAVQRIFDTTVHNINTFLDGKPVNVVLKKG